MLKQRVCHLFILALLTGLAYANSLKGEFLWDDQYFIVNNAYIKNPAAVGAIFTSSTLGGAGHADRFYRPLQMLSYAWDYHFWRLNPLGYHLGNLFWHLIAVVFLYWLICLLSGDPLVALVSGLLFALHPVQAEAVAYVSGRGDSLAAVFILLALVCYIKNFRSERDCCYIWLIAVSALAFFVKENSIVLIPLLLLCGYALNIKPKFKPLAAVTGIALIYLVSRWAVLNRAPHDWRWLAAIAQRIPGIFAALAGYVRMLIVPCGLHMDYGDAPSAWSDPRVLSGLILAGTILWLAVTQRKRHPLAAFGLFWFLVAFLPVSGLYPLPFYMADHYLYLPSIGLFIVAALLWRRVYSNKNGKLFAVSLAMAAALCLMVLTMRQNEYWHDPLHFYQRTLRYSPQSERMKATLAYWDNAHGRKDDAIKLCRELVGHHSPYPQVYCNLALIYVQKNELDEAAKLYNQARMVDPCYAPAYNGLAAIEESRGVHQAAVRLYETAIAADPYDIPAYTNLGLLYEAQGDLSGAIAVYRRALALKPAYPEFYSNLSALLAQTGHSAAAVIYARQAIALDYRYAPAYNNLALVYYQLKDYKAALSYCDQAIVLGYPVDEKFRHLLAPYREKDR